MRKLFIKKNNTPHELRPITSSRWFGGALKASQRGPGRSLGNFNFSSIFIDKKAYL